MRRAFDWQAFLRPGTLRRSTNNREYQRLWALERRRRDGPISPGIALLEERRLAMRPPPPHKRFAIDVLGIAPSHWYSLRHGAMTFGWTTLRRVLEVFPELREPMNRGAFGRPADRLRPPDWVAERLPDLLARGEEELLLPK